MKVQNEFMVTLAHELRSPLDCILNTLHLVRHNGRDERSTSQAWAIVDRQARNMARLIDDLLDVSRRNGKLSVDRELVDLTTVVARAVETTDPLVKARCHQLMVSLPQQPVYFLADASRLERILTNLLVNAAKYTDPGGRIWLTAEKESEEIVLRVRDTGIGIESEKLARIFDMFEQAEGALDHSKGGLGIGLAVVRRLVEAHGGRVTAFSAGPGQGSEFVVHLPTVGCCPASMQHRAALTDEGRSSLESPLAKVDGGK